MASIDEFTQASQRFAKVRRVVSTEKPDPCAVGQREELSYLHRPFFAGGLSATVLVTGGLRKRLGRARPASARRGTAARQARGDRRAAPLARLQLMKANIRRDYGDCPMPSR